MKNQPSGDLPIILLLAGIMFLFVGIRAIRKKKILRGRSSTEHLKGRKAEKWGWFYTVLGFVLAAVSLFMML